MGVSYVVGYLIGYDELSVYERHALKGDDGQSRIAMSLQQSC